MARHVRKLSHEERRERRRQMAELVQKGKKPNEIARLLGVSPRTVREARAEFAPTNSGAVASA